jgi:hypothetical protein
MDFRSKARIAEAPKTTTYNKIPTVRSGSVISALSRMRRVRQCERYSSHVRLPASYEGYELYGLWVQCSGVVE